MNKRMCVCVVWLSSESFGKQVGCVEASWNVAWFDCSVADFLAGAPDFGRHVSVATCEMALVKEGDGVHCVGVDDGGSGLWAVTVGEQASEEQDLLDAACDGDDLRFPGRQRCVLLCLREPRDGAAVEEDDPSSLSASLRTLAVCCVAVGN